jgi:hypothetical protein
MASAAISIKPLRTRIVMNFLHYLNFTGCNWFRVCEYQEFSAWRAALRKLLPIGDLRRKVTRRQGYECHGGAVASKQRLGGKEQVWGL